MTPERWQQIEAMYHAAMERAPETRAAFLADACAEDSELRREVEKLLQAAGVTWDFMDGNALENAAHQLGGSDLSATRIQVSPGQQIGAYEILAPLGKGGMGEVHLAHDARLGRKVAIKLLPAAFTHDQERVRRFEQEARAASALNHPNIITIHEIGVIEQTHFIVTEYIEGATLRQHLATAPRKRLPPSEAIQIATQIATALNAAHEAHIIHRDIKPENVMLRNDGIVKVLDFGLAKLVETLNDERGTIGTLNDERGMMNEKEEASSFHRSAFRDHPLTLPGTVMGTVTYMSPEQARGQVVDARSDIFSLGVVLYEMLAGRVPFARGSTADVLSAILHQEPAPLQPDLPAELQRIVTKALRKDRDERYQVVKELLLDLKSLQQELDFAAKLKGVQAFGSPSSDASEVRTEILPTGAGTKMQAAEPATNEATPARTTSSASIILSEIKRHKTGALIGFVGLLACVALLGYGVNRFVAPKPSSTHFQNVKLTRLTSVGNVGQSACVSPDGKFIAYVQTEAEQNSLWTKAIATGSAVQIVAPSAALLTNTMFSPDGDYVYYQSSSEGPASLYQIPVLGGTPKKVLTKGGTRITFSPDGSQFAFARRRIEVAKSELVVVNADGSGERVLATRELRDGFSGAVAWSPDGKVIAAVSGGTLLGVVVASGEVKPLVQLPVRLRADFTIYLEWFKDGSGLAVIHQERMDANRQLWQVSYPSGELRRITNDLATYTSLSMTADNKAMVAIQREQQSTLWVAPFGTAGPTRQLTKGNNLDGINGVRWSPDGRIVYTSNASGKPDLWLMNTDGSQTRPLTDDVTGEFFPTVAPDGRSLVYAANRAGNWNLWRMEMDGSNPRQLMNQMVGVRFDLTPDGRWIVFENRESEPIKPYKVMADGSNLTPLTDQPLINPSISPDGKLVACFSIDPQANQQKVLILPIEGGLPSRTLESKTMEGYVPLRWTPDSRSLLYVDTRQGSTNIWCLPLEGNAPQQVTSFNDARPERIWAFDLSRDGKQLVIARGSNSADVVLITEVK